MRCSAAAAGGARALRYRVPCEATPGADAPRGDWHGRSSAGTGTRRDVPIGSGSPELARAFPVSAVQLSVFPLCEWLQQLCLEHHSEWCRDRRQESRGCRH